MAIVAAGFTAAIILFPFFTSDPELAYAVAPRGDARRQRKTRRLQYAYETLWAEKQRVLRAIRDLDTDYDLSKLPDSIYAEQRIGLIRLYGALVGRIDELEAEMNAQRDRLEAALAAYRHRQPSEGE